ncbi:VPLPA-CTERM sorting domain-containing protein [Litoreibacter roseus]|uniref:VPLPA-CTERM protein sorting domain-containing protein n=1 Tax=Litoreibacter roseus TaxID=2601869 RepID=A0A6N6JDJ7_9RHOB|nr:VPLPA-CTERM sorting domain-containing protein [Litoreibacter roseus]GFE63449.1 hypothetical protein KIN_05230 [Litoreibacter roseus]
MALKPLLLSLMVVGAGGAASASTIDFNSFAHSDNVTSVMSSDGLVSANVTASGGINQAWAFNTNLTTTRDNDLEGPFDSFNGTSPDGYDAGNVLIIQENLNTSADDNAGGGSITFQFAEAVTLLGFGLFDDAVVTITSVSGGTTFTGSLPVPAADGKYDNFDVGSLFENVTDLTFTLDGSGAIDDLRFALTPIPVPAALPMLLAGIGGLGLVARRRARR